MFFGRKMGYWQNHRDADVSKSDICQNQMPKIFDTRRKMTLDAKC